MSILKNNIQSAIQTLTALESLEPSILAAAKAVGDCMLSGGKLLVCGNGGSAADGADFSTEFTCRFVGDRRPYPAIDLSSGSSLVTAIGNDYGFEHVFSRQVRAYGQKGDVLVGISTSGNSQNVLNAIQEAGALGVTSIALLGKDGGKIKGIAAIDLIVPCSVTARIQEAHKFILHTICELVEPRLALA